MDFTNHGALETLKWILDQTPGTPPTSLFIKLHVGDPGADATANPAVEITRQPVSFGTAINILTDGRAQATTDADVLWLAVASSESYSHISMWDDLTAGNAWYKGPLPAPVAVTASANFKFPIGQTVDNA